MNRAHTASQHDDPAKESKVRLFRMLDGATSLFSAQPLTAEAKLMWQAIMSRYHIDDIQRAFERHVAGAHRMPVPSDLIKIIEGNPSDRALIAWNKVIAAMRDIGDHRSICFDDPVIHLVVLEMGGWPALCRTTDDKLHFVGQDFQKRYTAQSKDQAETLKAAPRFLSGNAAAQNQSAGHCVPEEVVLYGDPESADLIFMTDENKSPIRISYRQPRSKPMLLGNSLT